MSRLSEVIADISEEIVRREDKSPWLPSARPDYSEERNMSRQKFAILSDVELCAVCLSASDELERRHPELRGNGDHVYPFKELFPSSSGNPRSPVDSMPPPAYSDVNPNPGPPLCNKFVMAQTLRQYTSGHDKIVHSGATREKLHRLTEVQFQEISEDTYDELRRRQSTPHVPALKPQSRMHPQRNKAREKLSALPSARFMNLASDIHHEMMRRYPRLLQL
ncbi:hypothetical protein BDN72DRAFT_848827 [Pluteus cervinus]|uniref:Uncharacterized protein n=1 Tax=Pluteus cervinus TaxID=181527 RepID=A0ACD3AA94_9AGAR|nr:hypothetical protein BDN72DRAFT_848827 [Pluteus cervinus]